MRRSILRRGPNSVPPQPQPQSQLQQQARPRAPSQSIVYPNSAIQQYLNMRRITKDKGCLIIFVLYTLGLIIMLGIGFFFGNYNDLGNFVNDNSSNPIDCNQLYVSQDMMSCTSTCASNYTFLGRVCLNPKNPDYNPGFTQQVNGLIQMYNIKYTFSMIIYISASLMVATIIIFGAVIYFPKLIYLLVSILFFMLLGMAFYLLKNFQVRTQKYGITSTNSLFYIDQQNTRAISFFLLGIYLVIFPFVLFSPKKIKLGVFLLQKIYDYYKAMSNTVLFSLLIIIIAWGTLIVEIFLVMHFYTSGNISKTPHFSMFHTYQNINLSHPASLTFHFIGVFWFYTTLISWHKYFISSSMCLWYFQDSQSLFPIRRGLRRSLHHIGTAALDGILMPIQWLFLLIYSVLKTNSNNEVQQQQQSCFNQCFKCFRMFFVNLYNSVNRDSSCSAVLTNQNYFESCRNSAQMFSLKNHRFFNIGGTVTIFLTLFVCVLWIVVMYFIVYFSVLDKQFPPLITSVVLPVFCVFAIGLVIGSLLTNIFTSALDCLLFCYLIESRSVDEGAQLQRNENDLKIKTVLDQCFYKQSEESKTSYFIYEQRDDNTMQMTYLSKKE